MTLPRVLLCLTLLALPAAADVVTTSTCLGPPAASYRGPTIVFAPMQSNLTDLRPATCPAPPAPGFPSTINSFFDIFVELSVDGGATFAPAPQLTPLPTGSVSIQHVSTVGNVSTYQTEMLQLSLTVLPSQGGPPVLIRESPTQQSTGTTTVTDIGGGLYRIDSFFDVFTELSIDGGQSWNPQTGGPARYSLQADTPEPLSLFLAGSSLLALGLKRLR